MPSPNGITEVQIDRSDLGIKWIDERVYKTREGFEEPIARCARRWVSDLGVKLDLKVLINSGDQESSPVVRLAIPHRPILDMTDAEI